MTEKKKISKVIRIIVVNGGKKIFHKAFDFVPIVFGRHSASDVHLPYTFLSRHHCQIEDRNNTLFLVDLNSRNGITYFGKKLEEAPLMSSFDFEIRQLKIYVQVLEKKQAQKELASIQETIVQTKPTQQESMSLKKEDKTKKQEKFDVSLGAETATLGFPNKSQSKTLKNSISGTDVPRKKIEDNIKIKIHSPVKQSSESTIISTNLNAPHSPHANKPSAQVQKEPQEQKRTRQDQVASAPPSNFGHTVLQSQGPALIQLDPHPDILSTPVRRLEAVITWLDQVLEVKEFDTRQVVTIGRTVFADINVPIHGKAWKLAKVNFDESECYFPNGKNFELLRLGRFYSSQELVDKKTAYLKKSGYGLKIGIADVVRIDLEADLKVFLRYIPATPTLMKQKLVEPDYAFKQAIIGSALLHAILSLVLFLTAPAARKDLPKLAIKPRYVEMMMSPTPPPVATPTPPPPATPPPKKPEEKPKPVVKEKPIEKPKPRPKPQTKPPKEIERSNKYPIKVKKPPPPQMEPITPVKPVKVEEVGALAILNSMAPPSQMPVPNNIQINKNAGGAPSKVASASGVFNVPSSKGGKLFAGGSGSIKTKGKGAFGPGSDYGTAGLQGSAGQKGIIGGIVGKPKLMDSVKNTNKPEGLSRAQVMAVVSKHIAEIQHCYEKNLLNNPDLAGRIEFEWDIEPGGSVSSVRVKKTTINGGDSLSECVKDVFRAMVFPKATNGMSTSPTMGFPFGRL